MSERSEALELAPLSLRHNFAWTLAGNGLYAACQWGMLVVLAKLGTPEAVGQFALALAVTAPVFMLTNLNLRALQSTDAAREFDFADYLTLRMLTTALALGTVVVLALGGSFGGPMRLAVLAVGLAKAAESLSDVVYGMLQQRERMNRIAASMVLRGAVGLGALGTAYAATRSVGAGALGLAVVWLAALVLVDLPAVRVLGPVRAAWRAERLRRLAALAAPLGVVMMLISLNSNLPRYFLERYHGEHAVGIYSGLAYLLVAGTMVVGALGNSASPRLARSWASRDRVGFGRLLGKLCLVGLGLGLAGGLVVAAAGRPVLGLLYSPEFAAHAPELLWLMGAGALGYVASFLGYGMTAARILRGQVVLFGAVAAACTIACYFWVPRFGILGAAWSMLVCYALQLVGAGAACGTLRWRPTRAAAD